MYLHARTVVGRNMVNDPGLETKGDL